MDSNQTTKLKKLIGPVGCLLLETYLKEVKLEIDAEKKRLTIIKDGKTTEVTFDEIEQFLSGLPQ